MTYGVKAAALLALALGCSTRSIVLDLRGPGGRGGGVASGGSVGTGGSDQHACIQGDDPGPGRTPPVAFDGVGGMGAPGAPVLVQGRTTVLGGPPGALAIADFDADGRLDVATASQGTVSVLVNLGDGTFAPRADFPITAGWTSIATGDVNGDGRLDIVVGGDGGAGVELLLNIGGARFRNVALCLCGGLLPSVALGDLDGDGTTDVVIANRMGEVEHTDGDLVVLMNDPASPFSHAPAHYTAGAQPRSVAVRDLNGDDRPDVVVGGVCGVSVLLNAGKGQLLAAVRYETVTGSIALEDIDGDGDIDIVDTAPGGWSADVLLNDGKGVFGAATANPVANPTRTAIGDLNGDGFADLAIAQGKGDYGFGVMLNDGDAGFGTLLEYAQDSDGYRAVAVGDIDGDAKRDVVLAGGVGVTVFLNRTP